MFITAGAIADCSQACTLVEGINAENLLADKGYDSDEFVKNREKEGVNPVIPPRKNRKTKRYYDKYFYQLYHLVENAFLELNAGMKLLLEMQKKYCFVSGSSIYKMYCYLGQKLLTKLSNYLKKI